MLAFFGSVNMDFTLRTDTLPKKGESILSHQSLWSLGGKGANQAVAATRAGGKVAFYGCIGSDPTGATIQETLSACNFEALCLRTTHFPTGCAVITVDKHGHNTIVIAPGANTYLEPHDIPEEDFSKISWVCFQLETPLEVIEKVILKAQKTGVKILLNASPFKPLYPSLLSKLDILIMNKSEAFSMADALGTSISCLKEFAQKIARSYNLIYIITLGEKGSLAALPSGGYWCADTFPVCPVDTTAAGDSFTGYFIASFSKDQDISTALKKASIGGSLTCLKNGAFGSLPFKEEVEQKLSLLSNPVFFDRSFSND